MILSLIISWGIHPMLSIVIIRLFHKDIFCVMRKIVTISRVLQIYNELETR